MDIILILLIIVLALALGVGAWLLLRAQRSRRLRQRFGPEYERGVAITNDRRAVESELRDREKRHRALDIQPLSDDERARFSDRWTTVQQGFVDNPGRAVREADALVDDVMRARGYPLDEFEQRAADISVEHAVVVQRYREARAIVAVQDAGRAGTEDLRQAVTSYRALIVALLEPGTADGEPRHAVRPERHEPAADPTPRTEMTKEARA